MGRFMTICFYFGMLGFLSLTLSCNEIPPQIPPIEPPQGDRKIIIEEFSGVQCPSCPVGAAQIENLKAIYGDRVIAVTHHAFTTGILSAPLPESKFDFRTQVSDEILEFLSPPQGIQGIPVATIDRREYDDGEGLFLSVNQWASKVESSLAIDAPAGLSILTSYDSVSRELEVNVRVVAQADLQGEIRFHMGLIESGMIDLQIDGNTVIEMYEHNHILRRYLTDAKGDAMITNMQEGEEWARTYLTKLPEGDGWWVAENMHVFGFVSKVEGQDKEVLQAEEVNLIQK